MPEAKAIEPLTEEQRRLVAEHVGLATAIARKRSRSVIPKLDREQFGCLGLIRAAKSYRPEKGEFENLACRCIRSAIIDAERAEAGGMIRVGLRSVRASVERGEDVRRPVRLFGEIEDLDSWLVGSLVKSPVEDRDEIETAMGCLSNKERSIVMGYWIDGKTMKQVGEAVGLSEAGVCLAIQSIIRRLRNHSALSHYAEVA